MTDKERIEALEKQVKILSMKLQNKTIVKPWYEFCKEVNLDERLLDAFDSNTNDPKIAQTKASICCIIGKSFCKNSVLSLDTEECNKAKPLVNFLIKFIKETRSISKLSDPVRGYERKIEYKKI